jgi:hypothetical protein
MNRAHGVLTQFGVTLAFNRLRQPDRDELFAELGVPLVWRRSVAEAVGIVRELDERLIPIEQELRPLARADPCAAPRSRRPSSRRGGRNYVPFDLVLHHATGRDPIVSPSSLMPGMVISGIARSSLRASGVARAQAQLSIEVVDHATSVVIECSHTWYDVLGELLAGTGLAQFVRQVKAKSGGRTATTVAAQRAKMGR